MTIETERLRARVAGELQRSRERTAMLTGSVEQEAEVKFKAAQAKAKKLGGPQKLTREDIDGLSSEQIKQLRGY